MGRMTPTPYEGPSGSQAEVDAAWAIHRAALECEKERERIAGITPEERRAELRYMTYRQYMQSPEWADRRAACIEADGGRCRVCNSTENLQAHHRTYERCKREAPLDLVTLCNSCHGVFHAYGRLSREAA